MDIANDPFIALEAADGGAFEALTRRPVALSTAMPAGMPAASVAVFHGFDVLERPLVRGLSALPGELVPARTAVTLSRDMSGRAVVLVVEDGDPRRPIIIGVLQDSGAASAPAPGMTVTADDERVLICAEREVVLRCGDASITLTRGGKVLIEGNFILSRSAGYNKIKGAAVDIN